MKTFFHHLLRPSPFLTPRGLVSRAAGYVVFFLILHMATLRRFTSILCGTFETDGQLRLLSPMLGGLYIAAYLGVTVVVPVFLLAAILLSLIPRRWRERPSTRECRTLK